MSWNDVVSRSVSKWTEATGPEVDVVLSSRIRLARNIDGLSFTHLLPEAQAGVVLQQVEGGVRELNLIGLCPQVEMYKLTDTSPLDRLVLVEKHLISRELAQGSRGRAVAIARDESVSIMINEEDHIRIQVLESGLQLKALWDLATKIDDAFEAKVRIAYHPRWGYLTACPTNVGTGLRASVMVHLPALVLSNQAGRLFSTLGQFGLAIRGFFGEGTEALGNIYQISNQITLGRTEAEIIQNLLGVVHNIIEHERRARSHMSAEMKVQLEDRIGRAYGTLTGARVLPSDEAMRLLSDVRLGVEVGLIKHVSSSTLNELLIATRPAFLQKSAGRELNSFERDLRRAMLMRQRLAA